MRGRPRENVFLSNKAFLDNTIDKVSILCYYVMSNSSLTDRFGGLYPNAEYSAFLGASLMRRAIIATILLFLTLTGCGQIGRTTASLTGYSRSCVEGVSYLQFTSGVTVEYAPDGHVKTCK